MDKTGIKLRSFCVEVINSKRKIKGKAWSPGTNSRLPFGVNVNLNLSNLSNNTRHNGQFLGISPQLFIFLSNFDQTDLPETRLRLSKSGFGTKCIESFLESH